MREYPALDVTWTQKPDDERIERLLADMDDDSPIAVEDRPDGVRVDLSAAAGRNHAAARLHTIDPTAAWAAVDVSDDDWAARSQASLGPIQVGRVLIATPDDLVITIARSMGFGTGHHASTRLCLALMQRVPLAGAHVLDVGTGSGILALAAWRLGAARVLAIDSDPDALTAAQENVDRNGAQNAVTLAAQDLAELPPAQNGAFDVVLANLTGTLLARQAARLAALASATGHLILSGIMTEEADEVVAAFGAAGRHIIARADDDGWVGLLLTTTPTRSTAR